MEEKKREEAEVRRTFQTNQNEITARQQLTSPSKQHRLRACTEILLLNCYILGGRLLYKATLI